MTKYCRTLYGRITGQNGELPVHGLLVRATACFGSDWHDGKRCKFDLGCDLTDRDGRYSITIDHDTFTEYCKCKGHQEYRIKVFDRDGQRIHSERRKVEDCPVETRFRFDLQIKDADLACHLARPLSWQPPSEKLLPESIVDDIEEALELAGDRRHRKRLDALICARPTLAIFDEVLRDAWLTLDGDLEAAERYRQVLDAICACGKDACCCNEPGAHDKAVRRILSDKCDPDPCKPVKFEHKSPCCKDGPSCPERESLVSDDKAALLAMAALHLSCGHKGTIKTYLVALLDQLCRFQFLTALHRTAVDVICEKPHALPHFRDLLEYLACKCDRDKDGYDCDAVPCCEICVQESLLDCLRDAYRNWCSIACYKITEVNPARACPGDKIVICGCGFGDEPGVVRFIQHGSMTFGPQAVPESWCDDRICVRVPSSAGCGLTLVPPRQTVNVCDRFLDYRLTGTVLKGFEGTSANILKFIIKGHQNDDCLLPGEILRIRWKTCAADRVVVRIVNAETGVIIAQRDPAEARGRWDFEDTDFDQTTRVRVEIVAHGACQPPTVSREIELTFQRPPNLTIDGVEVTQAIQHYRASQHLTDASDRGPDNSLQLVANKSAWIRTYLRSGQDPSFDNGQLGNVTGTLTVERRVGGVWSVVDNLVPVNDPVTAQDSFSSYNAERRDINATLNFVVPVGTMIGLLRFTIRVHSPDDCYNGSDTVRQVVDVDLDQELRIAAISVGYDGPPTDGGPDVAFAAPTAGEIATEAGYSLTVFPVRNMPNIRVIDTQTATQPLDDDDISAGGCDGNWTPILNFVANARTNDGNQADWFYYGFVTASIPRVHNNVGCANGGNGAGLLGGGVTLAHEIGHQAGLDHAPCGAVGTPEALYPLYEPYDTGMTTVNSDGDTVYSDASIGEYGLNINDGTIYNPDPGQFNNGKDLMSYCGTRWVSKFLHNFMLNITQLNPVPLATGVSGSGAAGGSGAGGSGTQVEPFEDVRPFITVVGAISTTNEVEVTSLVRVPTRAPTMSGERTDMVVELIGEEGEVASSAPVFTIESHQGTGCGCHGKPKDPKKPPFVFIAAMLDATEGRAIQIRKGEEVVWERKRPRSSVEIRNVKAAIRKDRLTVTWDFGKSKPAKAPEVWLQWSSDGETWNGLAVGLSGTSADLDPAAIPAGKVLIRAFAHDGFRSVSATSESVALPDAPTTLAILHPTDGQVFAEGGPLHLWGSFTGRREPEDPVWAIDGKPVGKGFDTWTTMPGAGRHEIELRATGAETAKVSIFVGDRPEP